MKKTSLEIILSDKVQNLLDDFASLLDVRVTFYSVDGERVRRGKEMPNCRFCELVQRELGGLKRCQAMDLDKQQEAMTLRRAISYRCHAGLHEAIAPVYVREQLVGYLMIGQFRTGGEFPSELDGAVADPDLRKKLERAFADLPVFGKEKLSGVLGVFRTLIDYIAVRELAVLRGDVLRIEIDRYLDRHLTENVMLPEMARRLGRSVSTISQFLRRNYHTGFKELLNEKRLKRAESYMLAHPESTVADAALAAGFSDQFYFSRVFSKRRGMPPGKFRDRIQKRHSMEG